VNSRSDDVDQFSKLIKLKKIVEKSPLTVISSRSLFLKLYKSGVYTGKCGTNLDHGVLAVIINELKDK
jgi:Papain family cysteine protease